MSTFNPRHPQFAWWGLFSVLAADLYIRLLQAARGKALRHSDTDCRRQRGKLSDGGEQGDSLGPAPMGKTICHLRSCYPGADAIVTHIVLPGARQVEHIHHWRSSHQLRIQKKGTATASRRRLSAHSPDPRFLYQR
ncbi:MAG TPA: hypothetical protein VIU62_17595 [Chloroflexota bacterium]